MPHPAHVKIDGVVSTKPHNVKVTSSDCETSTLGLICWKFGEPEITTIYSLPIRENGSTYFTLPGDHYVFAVSFQNVEGKAKCTVEVQTDQTPSTNPEPVGESTAEAYEYGVTHIDVFV